MGSKMKYVFHNRKQYLFYVILELFLRHENGQKLSRAAKVVYFVLFPIYATLDRLKRINGHDLETQSWTIYGIQYSDMLFRFISFEETGVMFSIEKRENGLITIKRCENKAGET